MHRKTRSPVAFVGALLIALLTGCGPYAQPTAERDCASEVLGDWSDGGIDGAYDDRCYVAALDALPEDLRAYTSAGDDIARALRSRRDPSNARAGAARHLAEAPSATDSASPGSSSPHDPPLPMVLLGGLLVLVAATGLASFTVRRHRGSP
jgi:hypothetical protein